MGLTKSEKHNRMLERIMEEARRNGTIKSHKKRTPYKRLCNLKKLAK